MKPRKMRDNVYRLGAVDWDRRLFDALIPLPDGTSYNAYVVHGTEKTALLDTVDPPMADILLEQLGEVTAIDYVVAHHAEQDHSGTIPQVIMKYPKATVIATSKGKELLMDLLRIPGQRILTVEDGESISLGDKSLRFFHTPWVHWPETMVTYLEEERILFSCDLFGSHIATTDIFVTDRGKVYEAAKRYYAEIMMPFRSIIRKNIEKVQNLAIDIIAPSHGPAYDEPGFIIDAYREWSSDTPKNVVVIPYVSMHGSTRIMVDHLVTALAEREVTVHQFDLVVTDIGKLAIALVDAATIVIGTPTVHVGPHPLAVCAASLANMLRPKAKYASVIGSYGWHSKALEQIAGLIPNLRVEILEPVVCKGYPVDGDFRALERLADTIAEKHKPYSMQEQA